MELIGHDLYSCQGASLFARVFATEGLNIEYVNKRPILVDQSIKLSSNLKPVIIADTEESGQLQYPEKALCFIRFIYEFHQVPV